MENLMHLFEGFNYLFTLQNIGVTMIGAVLGLLVGAMPGI